MIAIKTGQVLQGELPRKVALIIKDWCLNHQNELPENWDKAQQVEPLNKIPEGDRGVFDTSPYLAEKQGSLLELLQKPEYFKRCFINAGVLCGPNGLEFPAQRILELNAILEPHGVD